MKKQMIALAVAGAFVGSAFAANVTVYGVVDTGLVYSATEFGGQAAGPDTHSFTMENGVLAGSRFGFKGTEDLGNGYSVEFKLENGFDSDTGALHTTNKIFDREARLSLNTPYGQFSFGRMGALTSGAGTYDIFQATGDSLDGGNANYIGTGYWFSRARYDNMVTYATPEANGFKGYAQYSFKTDGTEDASVRNNERYAAIGLTYSAGPLNVVAVADTVLRPRVEEKVNSDAQAFSFGVNYDFEVTKAFFGAQYGSHEHVGDYYVKGYNLHLGAVTPLPCGELSASVYYGDYEAEANNQITGKKYGVGVVHTYPLSKRTKVYAGAGYGQTDWKNEGASTAERTKGYDVTIGLNHTF